MNYLESSFKTRFLRFLVGKFGMRSKDLHLTKTPGDSDAIGLKDSALEPGLTTVSSFQS